MSMFGGRLPLSPTFRAVVRREAIDRLAAEQTLPPPPAPPEYTIGLDLGQAADPSALCVVERTAPPDADRPPTIPHESIAVPDADPVYAVRHLHRWPLGTPYARIAEDVAALAGQPALGGPRIAADMTGCGRPVLEMIDAALAESRGAGRKPDLIGILITAGHATTRVSYREWHVAKRELVSALQAVLSGGRLKVAAELPLAPALLAELKAFRVKLTASANETFEAWRERDHDDLVLAVALGVWLADRSPRGRLDVYT